MSGPLRWAFVLAIALAAVGARAADEAQVLRQQAERLASQGRCAEAVERARSARALEPGNAAAALIEGRCLLQERDYAAALEPLGTARELDPSLDGLSTDLVQCHYHLDDLEAARREIERAESEQPDDARLQLYKGLVLARSAQNDEAAASFDRAASLDPSLADAASLYAGRTWTTLRDRERAEEALERASQSDPDSEWGRQAALELAQLRDATRRRAWLRVQGGLEWTDNVNLSADITVNQLNQELRGPFRRPRADLRGTWEADAGVELAGDSGWSTGVGFSYAGNAHAELRDRRTARFDFHEPTGFVWFDKRLGESTWLRLLPFGGFAWLGYVPFALFGGGAAELSTRFGEASGGRLISQVTVIDFQSRPRTRDLGALAPPATINFARRARNRDGTQYWIGAEANHTLSATETRFHLGTGYERYQAEGRDWTSDATRTWVGFRQPLPADFRFEAEGAYTWRPYEHRSSFDRQFFAGAGPKRRDQVWEVDTQLAHRLNEWLELAVHWEYVNQESNVRVFDFEEHVVGGTFTLFFGHY